MTAPPATAGGTRCPLCGAASRRRFARHGYWIRDCAACLHRFAEGRFDEIHVERVYDDTYFAEGGEGYPQYLADGRILRDRGRWYGRLLSRHLQPGSVLDVGCAAGFWLQGLADCGWRPSGIEPNPRMAGHARDRLGLAVRTGSIEELETGEPRDLVTMIQVVAHFRDPRLALRRAAGVLRPGGHLLIETWDRASWVARVMGRRWHEYSPPSVLHWFTRGRLRDLAGECGLREVAWGRPRKRLSAGHARSLVEYKYADHLLGRWVAGAFRALPDGLPLPYPGDDLFWTLLRL